MWILLHDDLADPTSEDPVCRESTRVTAAAVAGGQTSIDPKVIEGWLGPNVLKHRMINMAVGEATIEGALENLLLVMQKDRSFADDGARKALLRLFDMLGDDPAVTRYRARMFNLLH